MEDIEARALLTRLLDGEPPAPDIAPYIGRARRDTARRQWAFIGASAVVTAAVVAGVLVAPSLVPSQARQPGGQPGAPGAVTPSVKPPRPKVVYRHGPSTENPAAASARLTAALSAAYPLPAGTRTVRTQWDIVAPLHFRPSQGGYKASADIADARGTGWVFFEVDGGNASGTSLHSCLTGQRCSTTHAGDIVVISHNADAEPGIIDTVLTVYRADGTQVTVMAKNYGEGSVPMIKNPAPPRPQRPAPPLTEAQMQAIATSPGLSYYP